MDRPQPPPPIRFTGERPGRGRDFEYDEARHAAAYLLAVPLLRGKRVLDAGCGDGFGTAGLADLAARVVGVDASAAAVGCCRATWSRPNLSFGLVDLARPAQASESFDVVLAFQILEHMVDPAAFLEGLKRRLAPGGLLVLTTPNRLTSASENPFHVREYSPDELRELLGRVFADVRVSGIHGNERVREFERRRAAEVRRVLRLDPLHLRALLPRRLSQALFARCAVLVRKRVHAAEKPSAGSIGPDDFQARASEPDAAIDLLALCRATPHAED